MSIFRKRSELGLYLDRNRIQHTKSSIEQTKNKSKIENQKIEHQNNVHDPILIEILKNMGIVDDDGHVK